jgi:hypothetical protein
MEEAQLIDCHARIEVKRFEHTSLLFRCERPEGAAHPGKHCARIPESIEDLKRPRTEWRWYSWDNSMNYKGGG